ncbi:MAG: ParB/RepB/Spo0J family partition protein [Rickettsiales bacterium]|nr:ParB/RepB/Spo0J family partition protein [Rickettsiales bacterium]
MTDRKLGRGIASLLAIDDEELDNNKSTFINGDSSFGLKELLIENIIPNPNQPRKTFDDAKLRELSNSIKHSGLLQPIIVAKGQNENSGKYIIIAGERRYRATKLAGLEKIKAVIIDIAEKDILKNAIIENVQREDLNPVEEANGYKHIIEDFGYTHDQLAKEVGKSRSHITNLLRILNLPSEVIIAIKNGNITLGHAKVLLGTDDPSKYLDDIITKQLSIRQLEKLIENGGKEEDEDEEDDGQNPANITFDMIKQMYSPLQKQSEEHDTEDEDSGSDTQQLTREERQSIDNNLRAIENYLKQNSGFDVKLKLNQDGSGKLEVDYKNADELLKLVKMFQD